MQGVDISHWQPAFPPEWYKQWGFVVCKATEGHDIPDPGFTNHFGAARGNASHVGAYHYARPGDGTDGTQQADYFADTVLAAGFQPGVDLWQLDVEGAGNEHVTAGQWLTYIGQFRQRATERLGARALLYVGYYYWLSNLNGRHDILEPWAWWLPWYGPDDGQQHSITVQLPQAPLVIQYTTKPDNVDHDFAEDGAWSTWLSKTAAVNPGKLHQIAEFIQAMTDHPLKFGDSGPQVAQYNALLVHAGAPAETAGNDYGDATERATTWFKALWKLDNRDGRVAGRDITLELFDHVRQG